jgi:predicted RNA polymerase sigma factor
MGHPPDRGGHGAAEQRLDPRRPGPYQIQAAIAALHAQASTPEATDWPQIAGLYLWLEQFTPTAPVRLSRVVAVAEAFGPDAGLRLLDELDEMYALAGDPLVRHRFHAVRAHLLDRRGEAGPAAENYRAAADLTENRAERAYLLARAEAAGSSRK